MPGSRLRNALQSPQSCVTSLRECVDKLNDGLLSATAENPLPRPGSARRFLGEQGCFTARVAVVPLGLLHQSRVRTPRGASAKSRHVVVFISRTCCMTCSRL